MCLTTLEANRSTKRVGYKVLYRSQDGLRTGMFGTARIGISDKYTKDPNGTYIMGVNNKFSYPAGFHICLNKREANIICGHQGGVVCKVRFRKSVAVGVVQWNWHTGRTLLSKTVVAKEVKLVGENPQT